MQTERAEAFFLCERRRQPSEHRRERSEQKSSLKGLRDVPLWLCRSTDRYLTWS
jgi:hypothetical protein